MSSQNSLKDHEEVAQRGDSLKKCTHAQDVVSPESAELTGEPGEPLIAMGTDFVPRSYHAEVGDDVEIGNNNRSIGDVERNVCFSKEEDTTEAEIDGSKMLDKVGHEVRQYTTDESDQPLARDYAVLMNVEESFPQYQESDLLDDSRPVSQVSGTLTFLSQNPSQAVQAENVSPLEAEDIEKEKFFSKVERPNSSAPGNSKMLIHAIAPIQNSLSQDSLNIMRSLSSTIDASNKAFVDITITVWPAQFQTRLTYPVFNLNAFSGEGVKILSEYRALDFEEDKNGEWVLIARDLYESVARHICVHPQIFALFDRGKRVRFNSLMFLETERGRRASIAKHSGEESDAAQDPVATTRTEPLWLSLVFSQPAPALSKNATDSEFCSSSDAQFPLERGPGSEISAFQEPSLVATTERVHIPEHLATIRKDEFLVKCISVRKEKIDIDPRVLAEGRRQGFTFDEVIQSIYKQSRAVVGSKEVMTIVSVVQSPRMPPKAFIGGYRVKQDPTRLLLHATTQIFMKELDYSPHGGKKRAQFILDEMISRQSQTYGPSRGTQTRRECCVQTPRPDLLPDNTHDLIVVARPYFSAEALLKLRIEKTIIIQKMYRLWKARKICGELCAAERERQFQIAARQRVEEAAVRERANLEKFRRMNPHRANDFGVLKEEILLWRSKKAKSINENESLSGEQKREALLALAKEEVSLLQDLEQHRRAVQHDQRGRQHVRLLEKASAPKNWSGTAVITPETVRASELRDLFYNLTNNDVDATSRMDVLLHVKWTVKEFPDSNESRELCQLIDREADLINRGWKSTSLIELRKRITNIFRRFVLDPEYNPEMVRCNNSSLARQKIKTLNRNKTPSVQ